MARSRIVASRSAPAAAIPLRRKLLYALIMLGLAVGLPELLLRLFWRPRPTEAHLGEREFVQWLTDLSLRPGATQQLYREDPQRLWSLVPDIQVDTFNSHRDPDHGQLQPIRISINSAGYRGALAPPHQQAGSFRVLCLGDSNMFGYPLDDADTFPTSLARSLSRQLAPAPVQVINGGTPGYTVIQGRLWYDQEFQTLDYDWLVLSYLNNDAWPQPQTDAALLARKRVLPDWMSDLSNKVRLVQFAQSLRGGLASARSLVPRVSLEEFVQGYQGLIQSARQKGAKVLILDFRAYDSYELYSRALRQLADNNGAEYILVMERCTKAADQLEGIRMKYPDQTSRVERRWGAMLEGRPYLWFYAEAEPEHLNEVGTAWLADEIAPILTGKGRP